MGTGLLQIETSEQQAKRPRPGRRREAGDGKATHRQQASVRVKDVDFGFITLLIFSRTSGPWPSCRENLTLPSQMAPLAGAPAGKFLPDAPQHPGFIQAPGRGHQLFGVGVAGQAVNHQVGRQPFDEVHHAIDILVFGEADVLPRPWSRASPESLMT